jgi:hypothetical protein
VSRGVGRVFTQKEDGSDEEDEVDLEEGKRR